MSKQYGLIIPKQAPAKFTPPSFSKTNVFGDDSESDDESTKPTGLIGAGVNQKRQTRLVQEKAIAEDPTVYQYDEVYDKMEEKKAEAKKKDKTNEKKDPKYIQKLLENADKRKKEHERRVERQIQKEREAEGEEFAGKEEFVTSSYRKKLEEMKQLEEQEKREDYLESIGDVTKQRDLGGFYRHLYEQQLGSDKKKDDTAKETEEPIKQEPLKDKEKKKSSKPKRVYRKRSLTAEDAEEEKEDTKAARNHIQSNIDADSDFSIDSSSDSEDDSKEKDDTKEQSDTKESKDKEGETAVVVKQETEKQPQWNDGFKIPEKKAKIDEKVKVKEVEKKPKIDIWKKRTVGDVLQGAIERYYIRKAQRSARA